MKLSPVRDEGYITATLREQQQTGVECSDLLRSNDHNGETLAKEKHKNFLLHAMGPLPGGFVALDASKPWLLYWLSNSLDLLKYPSSQDELTRFCDSTLACQSTLPGGFGGGPGQIPHLAATYAAINTLIITGNPNHWNCINKVGLNEWVKSLKAEDGSFRMHDNGESDVRAVYCALSVCSLMGLITDELLSGIESWLCKCQTFEGGFGGAPGNEAHGGYTFCALAAFSILSCYRPWKSGKPPFNVSELANWLAYRQYDLEGGFSGRTNKLVDGCYSWWVGASYVILGDLLESGDFKFDSDSLREYILKCCQADNGGLRDKPSKHPDLYHTCYVLAGLSLCYDMDNINPVYAVNRTRLIDFATYFASEEILK